MRERDAELQDVPPESLGFMTILMRVAFIPKRAVHVGRVFKPIGL